MMSATGGREVNKLLDYDFLPSVWTTQDTTFTPKRPRSCFFISRPKSYGMPFVLKTSSLCVRSWCLYCVCVSVYFHLFSFILQENENIRRTSPSVKVVRERSQVNEEGRSEEGKQNRVTVFRERERQQNRTQRTQDKTNGWNDNRSSKSLLTKGGKIRGEKTVKTLPNSFQVMSKTTVRQKW